MLKEELSAASRLSANNQNWDLFFKIALFVLGLSAAVLSAIVATDDKTDEERAKKKRLSLLAAVFAGIITVVTAHLASGLLFEGVGLHGSTTYQDRFMPRGIKKAR